MLDPADDNSWEQSAAGSVMVATGPQPLASSGLEVKPVLEAGESTTGTVQRRVPKIPKRDAKLPRTVQGEQLARRLSTPDSSED